MNRRKAIQQIAVLSAGAALLPSCQFESLPVYEQLPLERNQYHFIEQFANAVLPVDTETIQLPESRVDFVLSMVNDCFAPKDIQRFIAGYQQLMQEWLPQEGSAFQELEAEKQVQSLKQIDLQLKKEQEQAATEKLDFEEVQSPTSFFYQSVKNLSQKHFTSSEYFLSQYLDYEFVPSRFNGCVKV